jgi:hypothetical protein
VQATSASAPSSVSPAATASSSPTLESSVCSVSVLGSDLWRGEHVIHHNLVHTLNYIAAQLFKLVGFMPQRCHFYTASGQHLHKSQCIQSNIVCIYELGVLNLQDKFKLGKDDFETADCMTRLEFQQQPPFAPAQPLGEYSRNFIYNTLSSFIHVFQSLLFLIVAYLNIK